jgi:hypothetical protein
MEVNVRYRLSRSLPVLDRIDQYRVLCSSASDCTWHATVNASPPYARSTTRPTFWTEAMRDVNSGVVRSVKRGTGRLGITSTSRSLAYKPEIRISYQKLGSRPGTIGLRLTMAYDSAVL